MNGTGDDDRTQKTIKCKAKLYRISNMQRCPYIHEMKERLLGEQIPMEPLPKKIPEPPPFIMDQQQLLQQQPVATVVKLNADGYGSHTSPTHHRTERAPLMPREYDEDDDHYVDTSKYPKNAKTSLFIIMSFVYAKLLIVVCVAYVLSDVITKHSIPAYYYEGFFTYLYGMSILFLLYVFCFLLQESTCCSGEKPAKVKKPKEKEKEKKAKEKEEKEKKKKEEKEKKKEEKEKKEKEKKEKDKDKDKKSKKQEKRERFPRKMRDLVQQRASFQSTYRRNSQGVVDEGLAAVPVPVAEIGARSDAPVVSQEQTPASTVDVEIGTISRGKKRKTTQNDQSHGSFFLRIGAIAFGLGTMIYNGLEFGAFFEIPFGSECYMILRGINPVLQMVFTFMQMYFIFMNSRLNIHRFKVIARFGLMHVVATNICVWIRTLVLEYIKEITHYHHKSFNVSYPDGPKFISDSVKYHVLGKPITTPSTTVASTTPNAFNYIKHLVNTTPSTQVPMLHSNPGIRRFISTTSTTAQSFTTKFWQALKSTTTTTTAAPRYYNQNPTTTRAWKPASTPFTSFRNSFLENGRNVHFLQSHVPNVADEFANHINGTEFLEDMFKQPWTALNVSVNNTEVDLFTNCTRVNIMGNIVQDSAPYLFPFIIEYSLIGAAVIYVMWKHIGRNPKYIKEEEVERRLEQMLCRRAVAMAHAQHGRVDCVGASKGLFFGLLMLVGSLICLILFFVLIHHRELGLLAIYLADVSHCVLMALSIIAIIVGFIRVQSLKFKTEEQSDLNDILLRVSAFGLFTYAVFSVIAGSLNAFTSEPNRLVMITGILSIVQVVLQLLFIADVSRRRVHLPEHDRSKPGRQVVTFLLICNVTMWIIYTFETQKVEANPVQLDFYGFVAWAIVQRFTLPLCIFHRFHSAVTLAEIWKTSYKARLE